MKSLKHYRDPGQTGKNFIPVNRDHVIMILVGWNEILGSNRPEVFCKIGVPKNFAKFTGKQLRQSLCLIKVASLSPATLLKRDSDAHDFL